MSSAFRAPAQIAPFKTYIADNAATGKLYDADGVALAGTVALNTPFSDMGKTIRLASGAILRKVQEQTLAGYGAAGYIYLTHVPTEQNIVSMN